MQTQSLPREPANRDVMCGMSLPELVRHLSRSPYEGAAAFELGTDVLSVFRSAMPPMSLRSWRHAPESGFCFRGPAWSHSQCWHSSLVAAEPTAVRRARSRVRL